MTEQITTRLAALRAELAKGQKMAADLDAQRAGLVQTVLRIEGAVQVLEELGAQRPAPPETPPGGAKE